MIQLHHCVSARSFRVLWMLEELALPYELKMLPFPPRVHARDFLALNPLGTVPAFVDDDVCAGRFTAADVSVGYALMLAELLDLAPNFPKSVIDYWQRLQDREAFVRALEAQEAAAIAQHVSVIPAPLVGS